jgi:hypothetical protein
VMERGGGAGGAPQLRLGFEGGFLIAGCRRGFGGGGGGGAAPSSRAWKNDADGG